MRLRRGGECGGKKKIRNHSVALAHIYCIVSFFFFFSFLSFFFLSFSFFFFFFPYNKAFNRNNFCNTKRKLIDADMYRDRYMLHGKTDI